MIRCKLIKFCFFDFLTNCSVSSWSILGRARRPISREATLPSVMWVEKVIQRDVFPAAWFPSVVVPFSWKARFTFQSKKASRNTSLEIRTKHCASLRHKWPEKPVNSEDDFVNCEKIYSFVNQSFLQVKWISSTNGYLWWNFSSFYIPLAAL